MTQLLDGTWKVYPCDRADIAEFIKTRAGDPTLQGGEESAH
jgi:hypothetical protein